MERPSRSPPSRSNLGGPIPFRIQALVALCLVALTSGAAVAATNPILSVGSTHADQTVDAGTVDQTVEVVFQFTLREAQEVYLKVLPLPENPAYRNGEPGVSGWWTDVALHDGNETKSFGATAGHGSVTFGVLRPGTDYSMHLGIHVPAAALVPDTIQQLDYSLAARAVDGNGTGAVRDPSVGYRVHITVGPGTATLAESDGRDWPLVPWMSGIAVAGVALTTMGWVRHRRNRADGPADAEA